MTYITDLSSEKKPRKLPARDLDPVELRILGCLAEKQMATPEYYPLTVNALVAACNQKSNREPVMELGESEVQKALDRLQDEKLVWRVLGGRATRWEHNLDANLQLDHRAKALLTLLLLRGPQTAGELRGRSDRLHSFEAIDEVEDTLRHLDPIVKEQPRRPGQKETRWYHTLGGGQPPTAVLEDESPAIPSTPLSERVQRLEEEIAQLRAELLDLKEKLGA
jgi:uncharacterized protein YceH (UPF0502 family)